LPFQSSDLGSKEPIFVRDRTAVVLSACIFGAATLAWIASYYLMPTMSMMAGEASMSMSGIQGIIGGGSFSFVALAFFLFVWSVGMIAMMFPAILPITLFYSKIVTRIDPRPARLRLMGTPLLLLGYLCAYAALGLGSYLLVYAAVSAAMEVPELSALSVFAPSMVMLAAALFQISPLKTKMLSQCISPITFFAVNSHKGLAGSFRMGTIHGAYCVGCCWAYMLIMLIVGAMSIPVMAILAGVIALEKVLVRGSVWFTRVIALALFISGLALLVYPSALMLI